MSIQELKKEKFELEGKIGKLIDEFQKKTGVDIANIGIHRDAVELHLGRQVHSNSKANCLLRL